MIFDLDGTLIDSSDGVVDAVNYSLRRVGAPEQPASRIKPFIGYPLSEMYPNFTDQPLEVLYTHFQERAAETIVSSTQPLNGATGILRLLHARGLRLGIATTKVRRHVDGIIDKLGWRPLFDGLVGGDEVDQVKPDPEALHLALRRLETRPEDAVVVGDTVNDVLAAHAVPMRVIAVESPYGGREELAACEPDHLITSLLELLALVENGRLRERTS